MTKRFRISAIVLVLAMLLCACAEIPPASSELPPASSESAEPSTSPDPTPTEAVSPTPAPTATPIPTKKPTATPTAKLTIAARPQGGTPEYKTETSFDSVDGLREFLLTEKETYEDGHYMSLFQSVRARGYFVKPVFTDEIRFETKHGMKLAFAVSESWFETPAVAYQLVYKDTDVLLHIHEIDEDNSQTVREHLYAHQSGKDLRDVEGYTRDIIKEKTVVTKSGNVKTWGKVFGSRYKIWFMLDDTHLVSLEWYTTDADAAEEFVSKLEFEKVEL